MDENNVNDNGEYGSQTENGQPGENLPETTHEQEVYTGEYQ